MKRALLLVGLLGLGGCGGLHLPKAASGSPLQQRMMNGNANPLGVGANGISPYEQSIRDAKLHNETPDEFRPDGEFFSSGRRKSSTPTISVRGERPGVSHYFAEDGSPEDRAGDGRLETEVNPPDIASPLVDAGFQFGDDASMFETVGWIAKQWREGREVWYKKPGQLWTGYRSGKTLEFMWRSGWDMLPKPKL